MGAISNYTGHRHTQTVHLERHVRPQVGARQTGSVPAAPDQLSVSPRVSEIWFAHS